MQEKSAPLHEAAWHGHSESVQLLLAAKGNIHAENRVSDTLYKYGVVVWS